MVSSVSRLAVVGCLALLVGCTTAVERQDAGPVSTTPSPTLAKAQEWAAGQCSANSERINVFFLDDESMIKAEAAIRTDPGTLSTVTETKAQALEHFKYMFQNQPEIVRLARVEALPASVSVVVRPGTDREALADRWRAELTAVDEIQANPCNT
ncbi:hypothetical protein JOD54_002753 [Actinokineospora baliensis]|uniref:permease-like cell division protein FtsX n=1 Tax=Actinokineospora baliensis TaxID=547056 RepID=UPI001959B319|nr:permease-like cell division protein FtsX [Actinokineospora baliensis]MBM7772549.1 hypothetical protein [Actinokineospora baliensis]